MKQVLSHQQSEFLSPPPPQKKKGSSFDRVKVCRGTHSGVGGFAQFLNERSGGHFRWVCDTGSKSSGAQGAGGHFTTATFSWSK